MCHSCNELMINGIRCHEHGCPDAWAERRECEWCGAPFTPEHRWQDCCGDSCDCAYRGLCDPYNAGMAELNGYGSDPI